MAVAQRAIEMILTRQLASYLAMPIFVVDPDGHLVYYNEPAEMILGCRFEETGELPAQEWSSIFTHSDELDQELPPESLPLMIALRERCPAHRAFWIRGLDQIRRHIEVTAFPLIGQAGRFLGVVAIFWESPPA